MIFRPIILGLLILLQGIGGKGGVGGKGGIGGVKGIPVPTLRCSSIVGSGAGTPSSLAIPICGAAQAGDFALLFGDAAFNITAVSGWTTIELANGASWDLYAASKTLSSGDISTGTVTFTAAGGFDMVGSITVFIGATSGVREFESHNGCGCYNLTTTSGVLSSDVGVYWSSSRTAGAPTIAPGSGIATSLQTNTTSNAPTKSALWDQFMAGGAQTNVYSNVGGLDTNMQSIQVIVEP